MCTWYRDPSRLLHRSTPDYSSDTGHWTWYSRRSAWAIVGDLLKVTPYGAAWGGFETANPPAARQRTTTTPLHPTCLLSICIFMLKLKNSSTLLQAGSIARDNLKEEFFALPVGQLFYGIREWNHSYFSPVIDVCPFNGSMLREIRGRTCMEITVFLSSTVPGS